MNEQDILKALQEALSEVKKDAPIVFLPKPVAEQLVKELQARRPQSPEEARELFKEE